LIETVGLVIRPSLLIRIAYDLENFDILVFLSRRDHDITLLEERAYFEDIPVFILFVMKKDVKGQMVQILGAGFQILRQESSLPEIGFQFGNRGYLVLKPEIIPQIADGLFQLPAVFDPAFGQTEIGQLSEFSEIARINEALPGQILVEPELAEKIQT
jgi:hypothetical protein